MSTDNIFEAYALETTIDADDFEDGVYFGMPDEVYHKINRLSSSGLVKIMISIADYWAASPMNPNKEPDKPKEHFTLGKAYHCAMFEPDELENRYAVEPSPADYAPRKILFRDTDVKAMLKEHGQVQSKAGELAIDRAERLMSIGYEGVIWSLVMAKFEDTLDGREAIKTKEWKEMQRAVSLAKREHPELVTDGAAEVVILYTCPDTGIKMKSKIDYLRRYGFTEYKSFDNPVGKNIEQCLTDAIKYKRYYIQIRVYEKAVEAIKTLTNVVGADDDQLALIDHIKQSEGSMPGTFLFQQKSGVPNVVARKLKMITEPINWREQAPDAAECPVSIMGKTGLCMKTDAQIYHAKKQYQDAMEIWGPDEIWTSFHPNEEYEDEAFGSFWLLDYER